MAGHRRKIKRERAVLAVVISVFILIAMISVLIAVCVRMGVIDPGRGTRVPADSTVSPSTETQTSAPDTSDAHTTAAPETTDTESVTTEPAVTGESLSAADLAEIARLFEEVQALLESPPTEGASVALYYEDVASGFSFSYNADQMFFAASLIKLPFAMELLYRLEEMEPDGLDDIFVYTEDYYKEGSGEIQKTPFGTTYTYHDLLIGMLKDSDNVAFNALMRKYGYDLIGAFSEREGLERLSYYDWNMCAADAVKVLRRTYEYIEGNFKYSAEVKRTMLSSLHSVMLCTIGHPVAHKYGWDLVSYHDTGIVYGVDADGNDRPYYLAFLSDMDTGGGIVDGYIHAVATKIDEIHTAWSGKYS